MPSFRPGLPEPGEYSSAFTVYVRKASAFDAPADKLSAQLDEVLALLEPLPQAKQLHRYADGKWSVKEVLGHLTDAERIFSYRALRIGRGDLTPLPGFDENLYVPNSGAEDREWDRLLDEFQHVRRASIALLENFPDAAWTRSGTSSGAPITVRALAYVMIGHVSHHLDLLRERYL